jgi:hypothetical protein
VVFPEMSRKPADDKIKQGSLLSFGVSKTKSVAVSAADVLPVIVSPVVEQQLAAAKVCSSCFTKLKRFS